MRSEVGERREKKRRGRRIRTTRSRHFSPDLPRTLLAASGEQQASSKRRAGAFWCSTLFLRRAHTLGNGIS